MTFSTTLNQKSNNMSKFLTWLQTNKVLLFGIASAIVMDLQQYLSGTPDWKVVGLSIAIAVTSYLAKGLRGQWVTILGSVASSLSIIMTDVQSHLSIGWAQIILTFFAQVIAAVAPAGKSLAYEQSATVEGAKAQAKAIDAAKKPPANPPVETLTPQPPKP
jgi:hypothetical protein